MRDEELFVVNTRSMELCPGFASMSNKLVKY